VIKRILFFFLSIYSLSFSVDEIDITSIKLEGIYYYKSWA